MTTTTCKNALAFVVLFFITLAVFAALPMTASASTDYFVHQQTGSDSNAGASTTPFKTIGKALNSAVAGDKIILQSAYTTAAGEDIYIPADVTLDLNSLTLTISAGTTLTNEGVCRSATPTHIIVSGGLVNFGILNGGGSSITVNGVFINKSPSHDAIVLGAQGFVLLDYTFSLHGTTYYAGVLYAGAGNTDDIDSITFDTSGNISNPPWLGSQFKVYEIVTENDYMLEPFTPGSYKLSPAEQNEFKKIVLMGLPGSLFYQYDTTLTIKPASAVCVAEAPEAPEAPGLFKAASSGRKQPREHYGFVYYVPDGKDGWKIWGADFGHSRGDYATITDRSPNNLLYWSTDERGLGVLRYKPGDRRLIVGNSSLYAILDD